MDDYFSKLYGDIQELADNIYPIYEHIVNANTQLDVLAQTYESHIDTYNQLYRGLVLDINYMEEQIAVNTRQNLGLSYTKRFDTAQAFADDNWAKNHIKCIVVVDRASALCVMSILKYYTKKVYDFKNKLAPWIEQIEQNASSLDIDSTCFIDECETLINDIDQQLDHALTYADREDELIILQDIYPTNTRITHDKNNGQNYTVIEATTSLALQQNNIAS